MTDRLGGGRALLRRNRPSTVASSLLVVVITAFMAAAWDYSVYVTTAAHYAKHGHSNLGFADVVIGTTLTGLAICAVVYLGWDLWRKRVRMTAMAAPSTKKRARELGKP